MGTVHVHFQSTSKAHVIGFSELIRVHSKLIVAYCNFRMTGVGGGGTCSSGVDGEATLDMRSTDFYWAANVAFEYKGEGPVSSEITTPPANPANDRQYLHYSGRFADFSRFRFKRKKYWNVRFCWYHHFIRKKMFVLKKRKTPSNYSKN